MSKKLILRLLMLLAYLLIVISWDKYIFESVLLMETWMRATASYWNEPKYKKMFDLQEVISKS